MEDKCVSVETGKALLSYVRGMPMPGATVFGRSYAEWDLELKQLPSTGELQDANVLHVDVVSHTTEQQIELAARGGAGEGSVKLLFTVPMDIAIRKRFDKSYQDASTGMIQVEHIDALQLLTQHVHVACSQRMLPDFGTAIWKQTQLMIAPDPDMLRQFRQYTSILRITFAAYVEHTIPTHG